MTYPLPEGAIAAAVEARRAHLDRHRVVAGVSTGGIILAGIGPTQFAAFAAATGLAALGTGYALPTRLTPAVWHGETRDLYTQHFPVRPTPAAEGEELKVLVCGNANVAALATAFSLEVGRHVSKTAVSAHDHETESSPTWLRFRSVSYTHLTLPTILLV